MWNPRLDRTGLDPETWARSGRVAAGLTKEGLIKPTLLSLEQIVGCAVGNKPAALVTDTVVIGSDEYLAMWRPAFPAIVDPNKNQTRKFAMRKA